MSVCVNCLNISKLLGLLYVCMFPPSLISLSFLLKCYIIYHQECLWSSNLLAAQFMVFTGVVYTHVYAKIDEHVTASSVKLDRAVYVSGTCTVETV